MKDTFRRSYFAEESEYEVSRGYRCKMMPNTINLQSRKFKIDPNISNFQAEKVLPVDISTAEGYFFSKVDDPSFHMTFLASKTMQCLLIYSSKH